MSECYYTDEDADKYDDRRFSGKGGKYIRETERQTFLDLIGDLEGKKVLDVATGTGRLAIDMAERGADVTATDISEDMIKEAKRKSEKRNLDIDFFTADAKDLELEDSSFDIVTAQRFLHLVSDHRPYLEEMKRVGTEKVVYDYFNFWSFRISYDWLLPMDSHLHRKRKADSFLQDVGLSKNEERRKFLTPYGLIRQRSGLMAKTLVGFDKRFSKLPLLERLNSIVYISANIE